MKCFRGVSHHSPAWLLVLALLAPVFLTSSPAADAAPPAVIHWKLDNLETVGGNRVELFGEPKLIETPRGRAVEFDGVDDGLLLEVHPLAGFEQFTAEVIFRPAAEGPKEQRFFHMQAADSEDRVMFETRLTSSGEWFLDTYIKSGEAGATLYAEDHRHPIGPWYHAALVVDGKEMRHYVNGKLELSQPLPFKPQSPGRTSLGVRQNRVHWYKGAIREARFTPRVLGAKEFLTP